MSRLRDTMFDLLSYKYIEADWDGYGAIKPHHYKIAEAWEFLRILIKNEIPIPKVMISGTSMIGFYWDKKSCNKDVYVEIDIFSKGDEDNEPNADFKSFAYLVDSGHDYFGEDDIKFKDFKDSKVHNFFKENMPEQELDDFDEYYFNLFAEVESLPPPSFSIDLLPEVDEDIDKEIDKCFSLLDGFIGLR